MKISLLVATALPLMASAWRSNIRIPKAKANSHRELWFGDDDDDESTDLLEEIKNVTVDISAGDFDLNLAGCFSELATVQVLNKRSPVPMKDLQIGDLVKTATSDANKYEPVYAFGHWDLKTVATFLQIHTTAEVLELTGEHLVFAAKTSTSTSTPTGGPVSVRADNIKVGDTLEGGAVVTKIGTVQRSGLYAPLTASGKVLVNGISASSYISLQKGADRVELKGGLKMMSQHDFVHVMVSPFRIMCNKMSSPSSLCHNYSADTGMPKMIESSIRFAKWCDHKLPLPLQALLFAVFILMGAAFTAVESVLVFFEGGATTMMVLAATAATIALGCKAFNIRVTVRAQKIKTV